MINRNLRSFVIAFSLIWSVSIALGQSDYLITQWTIASSSTAVGDPYVLSGTLGEIAVDQLSGEGLVLSSGYMISNQTLLVSTKLYLPIIKR